MGAAPIKYNDEWIVENLNLYSSYKALSEAHNQLFGTAMKPVSMKNHCRLKLQLNKERQNYRPWTSTEDDWMRENYPNVGVKDSCLYLNRSRSAVKGRAILLGITVKDDIATANKRAVHLTDKSKKQVRPVGYMKKECGRWVTKTKNGWVQSSRVIFGLDKIPEGYCVIFLDGNVDNLNPENLYAVPVAYLGMMDRNGLRSTHPEITKTAIKWCDLKTELKGE